MYRTLPYLALFAATVLLQVFLFDNLSISVYLNPLVYIAFIVLLPLDTPPVVLLGAGLALGVTMDGAMGAAGINTSPRCSSPSCVRRCSPCSATARICARGESRRPNASAAACSPTTCCS